MKIGKNKMEKEKKGVCLGVRYWNNEVEGK
jgi:hypothetical protein